MPDQKNKPYVVSGDVHGLLSSWAEPSGFRVPDISFCRQMATERVKFLQDSFHLHCIHDDEEELSAGISEHLSASNLPVISLDQNYVKCPHIPLEVSRLCDPTTTLKGQVLGSRNETPFHLQLEHIARLGHREVQLVDDVIFTAEDLTKVIIPSLKERGVAVKRIVAGILVGKGRDTLAELHPDIEVVAVRHYPEVWDEVCERDFLAGVPQSGRLFGRNGVPIFPKTCAPYFRPWCRNIAGKCLLHKWATLGSENNSPEMERKILEWSQFCLEQSIRLWEEIERLSGRLVHCDELEQRPWGIPCDGSRFVDNLVRTLTELERS